MKRQANQIKSVGKSMSSFGSSLTKNVTAPILATLGATGKMADTFEKDMGQVNTLLDNKEHLQKYKDTAIQVSNDTGIALGTVVYIRRSVPSEILERKHRISFQYQQERLKVEVLP